MESVPEDYVGPDQLDYLGEASSIQRQVDTPGPNMVTDFADVLLRRVEEHTRHMCFSWVGMIQPLTICTMCSGTDSPVLALLAIARAMNAFGVPCAVDHLFSAEINPRKQKFLKKVFPTLRQLFCSVHDIKGTHAKNLLTDAFVSIAGGMIVIAGFPCTDISSLNCAAKRNRGTVRRGNLRTGSCLHSILAYVAAHSDEVRILILENVKGLAGKDLNALKYLLRKIGFEAMVWVLNPRLHFGIPQNRPRF